MIYINYINIINMVCCLISSGKSSSCQF